MQPWKMFIRSASVVTLLTVGAFAAGQAVVPFANTSRNASPAVEEEAPDTEAPTVDPAAEVDETDSTTTTTEVPKSDAPSVDPVEDPAPTTPPADEAPEELDVTAAPPAVPVADPAPAAPKVKKDKKDKKVKGDHNCDGHLDNGWHNDRVKYPNYPAPNSNCPPTVSPAPAPAAPAPAPAPQEKGRSASAPGHTMGDRPESAPGYQENRPAAPGQAKKGL